MSSPSHEYPFNMQQPPIQPRRRKRHIPTILIGVIAFFAVLGIVSSLNKTPDSPVSSGGSIVQLDQGGEAKIGTPVRDGQFEFTVTAIQCGIKSVGTNTYMTKKAQGQFCKIALKVKNIGDSEQSMFSMNQKMFVDAKKYSADDTATMYDTDLGGVVEDVNPGNEVGVTIVYDLPKNAKPTSMELHDSMLSGGAGVQLK